MGVGTFTTEVKTMTSAHHRYWAWSVLLALGGVMLDWMGGESWTRGICWCLATALLAIGWWARERQQDERAIDYILQERERRLHSETFGSRGTDAA